MLPRSSKLRFLNIAANLALAISAIIFVSLFIQRYVFSPRTEASPTPGTVISFNGFSPVKDRKSVILFYMKGCKHCEASAEFHQRIVLGAQRANHQVIFVFPSNSSSLESYLTDLGFPNVTILNTEFSAIGVSGTPSIVVTDGEGEILGSWMGRLSRESEQQVLQVLAP